MSDKCPVCNNPAASLAVVPYGHQLSEHQALACMTCFKENGIWCTKHNAPFAAWSLGGFLCLTCLVLLFSQRRPEAVAIYTRLLQSLPSDQSRALVGWAGDHNNIQPLALYRNGPEMVLWSVCASSLVRKESLEQTLAYLQKIGNLEIVIPQAFPISIPE